jgi:hypothetical protein
MGGWVGKQLRRASHAISGAVSDVGSAVIKTTEKIAKGSVNIVKNIIKNPLPTIETIALTAVGVPAPLASAMVTAANGGNVRDIAISAATAYAGQQVSKSLGVEGKVQAATNSRILATAAASAVGSSTQATLTALANGKNLQQALESGAKAGIAAGITSGGIEYISPKGGPAPVEERSDMSRLPKGDTGLTAEQEFPSGMASSKGVEKAQYYVDIPTERKLLSDALQPKVYSALFGQRTTPLSAPAPAPVPTGTGTSSPTQTASTVGSQALGQALRVGDAGSPVFGGDKEEGKKSGWNTESLRYMGNSET